MNDSPDQPDDVDDVDDAANETDARLADGLAIIWEAYRMDEIPRATAAARALVTDQSQHGEAWFWYGCCLERTGDYRAADKAFMREIRTGLRAAKRGKLRRYTLDELFGK